RQHSLLTPLSPGAATRRECGFDRRRARPPSLLARVSAAWRTTEKSFVKQAANRGIARGRVHAPESLCLTKRQTQGGQLAVLASNPLEQQLAGLDWRHRVHLIAAENRRTCPGEAAHEHSICAPHQQSVAFERFKNGAADCRFQSRQL